MSRCSVYAQQCRNTSGKFIQIHECAGVLQGGFLPLTPTLHGECVAGARWGTKSPEETRGTDSGFGRTELTVSYSFGVIPLS